MVAMVHWLADRPDPRLAYLWPDAEDDELRGSDDRQGPSADRRPDGRCGYGKTQNQQTQERQEIVRKVRQPSTRLHLIPDIGHRKHRILSQAIFPYAMPAPLLSR